MDSARKRSGIPMLGSAGPREPREPFFHNFNLRSILSYIRQANRRLAQISKDRLACIQVLRCFAVFSVVFWHILYELRNFNIEIPAFIKEIRLDFGVDIFFIISGFIMIWGFGERFGQAGAPRQFLQRRIIRIVPLYWFFTILVVLVLLVRPDLFDHTVLTLSDLLQSLFFIPHYGPHGEVRPLHILGWTLNYEMMFYIVFALSLFLNKRAGILFIGLALGGIFLIASQFPKGQFAIADFLSDTIIFEFFLGVLLCLWTFPNRRLATDRALAVLGLSVILWAATQWTALAELRFFNLGMPALAVTMITILVLYRAQGVMIGWLVLLGEASYVIYLSHPFILEETSLIFRYFGMFNSNSYLQAFIYVIATLISICIISVIFHLLIERPINKKLKDMMMRSSRMDKVSIQ